MPTLSSTYSHGSAPSTTGMIMPMMTTQILSSALLSPGYTHRRIHRDTRQGVHLVLFKKDLNQDKPHRLDLSVNHALTWRTHYHGRGLADQSEG
jgi:hypothetical protein